MNNLHCLQCGLSHIKRHGHTSYGKQNYRCQKCGRQFVTDSQQVSDEKKELIKGMLLERLSLRGICRCTAVSLSWLLGFIAEIYADLPDHLKLKLSQEQGLIQLLRLEAEADELWSFVARKENKQWVWLAIDAGTKQVIAFSIGDRSRRSAKR